MAAFDALPPLCGYFSAMSGGSWNEVESLILTWVNCSKCPKSSRASSAMIILIVFSRILFSKFTDAWVKRSSMPYLEISMLKRSFSWMANSFKLNFLWLNSVKSNISRNFQAVSLLFRFMNPCSLAYYSNETSDNNFVISSLSLCPMDLFIILIPVPAPKPECHFPKLDGYGVNALPRKKMI